MAGSLNIGPAYIDLMRELEYVRLAYCRLLLLVAMKVRRWWWQRVLCPY